MLLPLLTLLTTMIGMDGKVTELVVFHPVDQIYNSISSWILTTAIDFNPHKDVLFGINQYALKVKQSLTRYSESFHSSDQRYSFLLNMTVDDINLVLCEITSTQIEAFNLINHIHRPKDIRTKRSLLTFGGLFHFLFGTVNDEDVRSMKQDMQKLYENQITQCKVLNDVISIANILGGLINENIMKISQIISTITFINDTMDSIMNQLRPLFLTRRFLLLHTESLIHHSRIRSLLGQLKTDTALIKAYLNIHITEKLTPSLTDPAHLRQELLQINIQLPARRSLPEDLHGNIWHYYRFLPVNPIIHGGNVVLMIRIPLIDLDSGISLYDLQLTSL